ncbi:MAG: restriction endonuclease subunit S [Spirochaetaceae bacterium]|nr:restriction endonuclease subunit S [Spirochaetaceae bacterium]
MSKLDDLINELCPNGVETYPFSVVFDEIKGMGGVTNKWAETGNCRFIDYLNAYNNLSIDVNDLPFATVKNLEQDTLRKGDILFTSASEVPDECAIASAIEDDIEEGIFLDDHLFGLRPNSTFNPKINTGFLKHYFHSESYRKSVLKAVRGVTRFYISKPNFMKIILPIPPLEVQDEIVRILDNFTSLEAELEAELEARRRQYEYYRDSLLTFGDDVEWKTIGELFDFKNGLNKDKSAFGNGIPFVKYTDVYNNKKIIKELLTGKVQLNEKEIESFGVHKGDVLFTRCSETKEEVGFASAVTEDLGDCAFNGFVLRARPKTDLLLPDYCAYCFRTSYVRKEIIRTCSFTTRANTTGVILSKIKIPVPSHEKQKQIVTILDRFESLCNDITSGLPAEIETRHKQYEYYRDKLLTFKRKEI